MLNVFMIKYFNLKFKFDFIFTTVLNYKQYVYLRSNPWRNSPICNAAKNIIDTPEYQRLRNIKQGGAVYWCWVGSSHHRFEHSIGVYHLSRRLMDLLIDKYSDCITNKQYELISVAALIHDLGHCISSHLFDDWLKERGVHSEHEERSIELFKFMNKKYGFDYTDYDITFISNVINPDYDDLEINGDKNIYIRLYHLKTVLM